MVKIKCDVLNCSHNKKNVCYANVINIRGKSAKRDENTCCASFLESKVYGTLTNNVNNLGRECISISCNVDTCKYNSYGNCNADSIDVRGEDVNLYIETECSTFNPKDSTSN